VPESFRKNKTIKNKEGITDMQKVVLVISLELLIILIRKSTGASISNKTDTNPATVNRLISRTLYVSKLIFEVDINLLNTECIILTITEAAIIEPARKRKSSLPFEFTLSAIGKYLKNTPEKTAVRIPNKKRCPRVGTRLFRENL
jgi:hypothetical protein